MFTIKKGSALTHYGTDDRYKIVVTGIIITGIFLRLFHYFDNRSLWEDEIYLSTGIVKLSFTQLLHQGLDFQQKAPIGYLLAVKLCTLLFGGREMGLRLFPLLCGIASLFVFLPVAKYFLKNIGVIVAMAILCIAPPLVYHSVEAKQYCTELFATILILYTYTRYHTKTAMRSLIVWGILGAVIVWFSYTAVFIFAGIAFTIGLNYLVKKQWHILIKLFVPFALWFGSFAINYLMFTQKGSHTGWLVYFFMKHDAFMPMSGACVKWIGHKFFGFFNYPLGLSWEVIYKTRALYQMLYRMAWLPLLLTLTGIYYLYKNNKKLLVLIAVNLLIVFAASALKLYPIHERLMVFLAPLLILLLAAGCQALFKTGASKNIWQWALVVLLLFGPLKNSVAEVSNTGLFGDYKKSYHREALLYLNEHYQPGDVVYVYWNDLPAWHLYKKMYPLKYTAMEGADHRYNSHNFDEYFGKLDTDFKHFAGKKRVWIVSNNFFDIEIGDYIGHPQWYYAKNDGVKRFDDWLMQKGKLLDEFKIHDKGVANNVSVRLMDFSAQR